MLEFPMPSLSPHLFWDTDPAGVDPNKHAAWLVRRVLEYGLWRDWQILLETYGRTRLGEIATSVRGLQPRTASFVQAYFSQPA